MSRAIPIVAVLAVAGCGSDDAPRPASPATPPTTATTTTAPAAATTTPDRGKRPSPAAVRPERRKLEAEGYDVRASGTGGLGADARGALEAPLEGGGGLTIIAYATRAAAERKADEFRALARKYPDYFRVEVHGTTVYLGVAEQPEKLTKTGFSDAVAAATTSR